MSDRDDLIRLCLPHILWGNGHAGTVGALAAQHAAGELADAILAAGWRAPEPPPPPTKTVRVQLPDGNFMNIEAPLDADSVSIRSTDRGEIFVRYGYGNLSDEPRPAEHMLITMDDPERIAANTVD